MLIGYARVSTSDQNLDFQKEALLKIGCERIYEDEISGTIKERPGLNKTLEILDLMKNLSAIFITSYYNLLKNHLPF